MDNNNRNKTNDVQDYQTGSSRKTQNDPMNNTQNRVNKEVGGYQVGSSRTNDMQNRMVDEEGYQVGPVSKKNNRMSKSGNYQSDVRN